MTTQQEVLEMLDAELELGGRARGFSAETRLMGDLPELDSMAVAYVVAAMEERFGIRVADDEISASVFATVGSLVTFIEAKQAENH